MVTHIARVWINRVSLPILHVVSRTEKMNISLFAFAPEDLVSLDGFGSPVPRQPVHLHTQAESGAYLRDYTRVPRRRPFIYLKCIACRRNGKDGKVSLEKAVATTTTKENGPRGGEAARN